MRAIINAASEVSLFLYPFAADGARGMKNSQEMRQVLEKLNGTTGVIMADVDRVLELD